MSPHARGIFYGLLSGISLSFGGLIVRMLSQETNAWQFLSWRSYSFSILMFSIALWRSGSISRIAQEIRAIGWLVLPITIAVGLGQVCYVLGLQNTLVANVAFIVGSAPVFTAFAAWLILGERLTLRGIVALLAAVSGVAIMFTGGLTAGALQGNLFALVAMATYVAYVLLLRYARNIDTFVASGLGGLFGMAIAVYMTGGELTIPVGDLALSVISGTFQVGAGFAFATMASKLIPAAEVTLLIMIEAILGPLLVWLVISETPHAATLLGGVIIITSVAVFAAFAIADERGQSQTHLGGKFRSTES